MNPSLLKKYNQLEDKTEKFVNIIAAHSEEQQRFRPSEYEWGMLDVMEHLINAETGTNRFFEKYKPEGSTRKMKLKNYFYSSLTQIMLATPTKIPAPARLKPPQGDTSFEEWKATWNSQRTIFKQILETFPEDKMNYSVFKHPRSGPMDIKNVIDFMKNHVVHHIYQLNRIRKHKDFPKN